MTKKTNTYKNPHLSKEERRKLLGYDEKPKRGRPKKTYPTEVNKKEKWYSPDEIIMDLKPEKKSKEGGK